MRIEGTFLRSRIARRFFLLFCLAALLPTVLLSLLIVQSLNQRLAEANGRDAVALSKTHALAVFERLDLAYRVLELLAAEHEAGEAVPEARLHPFFRRVFEHGPGAAPPADPGLAAALAALPAAGDDAGLLVVGGSAGAPASVVQVSRPALPGAARLAAELDPEYLWGSPEEYAAGESTCAVGPHGELLFCTGEAPAPDGAATAGFGRWELFLKARFGAEPWTFETRAPPAAAQPLSDELLLRIGAVWASALLLVVLLSLTQIRRSMVPLEALIEQTGRLASGQWQSRPIETGDEFGALGRAFDRMALQVTRQLDALNALAEVDHGILRGTALQAIADAALARLARLLPDHDVALCWEAGSQGEGIHRHLRPRGAAGSSRDLLGGRWLVVETAPRYSGPADVAREPQQSLAAAGASHCHVACFDSDRAGRVWVAVGSRDGEVPGEDARRLVDELGARFAVALASREREAELLHQSRHDLLTGLPNRLAAHERIAAALARGGRFAVFFFDLDRFKLINDSLGHGAGDKVLVEVARLLRQRIEGIEFVARFGGDEFFAIAEPLEDRAAAAALARRIVAVIDGATLLDGLQYVVSTSVGIALHPDDGATVEALMRSADIAMYAAKRAGGATHAFFDAAQDGKSVDRVRLESDFRAALTRNQVAVEFQARVDARTRRITGAEALARWHHAERGRVPPSEFVALAEESDLIAALGEGVLERSCSWLAGLRRAGLELLPVAVNVSPRQLRREGFVEVVRATLERHGLPGSTLEIEITEGALVEAIEPVTASLERLRGLGVRIAIDDFGTGYSSLGYLRLLPVDILKIDQSFVRDIDRDPDAAALARSIVALGLAAGKEIVAEGVEREAQAELLARFGCRALQGWHFHRASAGEALRALLAAEQAAAGDA